MKVFFTGFLMCLCVGVCCQYQSKLPADEWVDSVFASLNKKQRIAQLMIIRAHSNKGQGHIDSVTADIKKYKSGNVKKLLSEIYHLPVNEQRERLKNEILEWRGELQQVDDILFIGTKIPES